MVSKEDWSAALSSEVFREYLNSEIKKEASLENNKVAEERKIITDFEKFEKSILANPKLRVAFKQMQEKMAADDTYRKSLDPKFAEGVMLLDLEEEK